MLVLTRKKEETILIGDDIEILIVDVGEDRVKIGINAPKNIKIVRKELLEQIKKRKYGIYRSKRAWNIKAYRVY